MNRNGYRLVLAALLAIIATNGVALADNPNPNSAVINERVFNDCPVTTLTVNNSFPTTISMHDVGLGCSGFANLHNWRLSDDGANALEIDNASAWSLEFDMVIDGSADGEGGLSLAPWWSPNVDGRFNVRTTDGEIACFGGRLPFYSFTANHGLNYVKGDVITLRMEYRANSLNAADPATIVYEVTYGGSSYSSGELAFDQGNPAEADPYGLYGALNFAQAGGYVQEFMVPGDTTADLYTEWSNIRVGEIYPVAGETTTWGDLKSRF